MYIAYPSLFVITNNNTVPYIVKQLISVTLYTVLHLLCLSRYMGLGQKGPTGYCGFRHHGLPHVDHKDYVPETQTKSTASRVNVLQLIIKRSKANHTTVHYPTIPIKRSKVKTPIASSLA